MKKIILAGLIAIMTMIGLAGCTEAEADVVNHNISKSADSFEINRRIIFLNGITDKYLFTIEGLCSLDITDGETSQI